MTNLGEIIRERITELQRRGKLTGRALSDLLATIQVLNGSERMA